MTKELYKVRMIKETSKTETIVEFNDYEVHTIKRSKTKGSTYERFEKLCKYSRSLNGYRNQLLLLGYKEI